MSKNKLICLREEEIGIVLIRGLKVMLDRELARLYGVETRALNQAVKRNKERFPEDFAFALTREEIMNLSQSVISSNIKHAPNVLAFTEQGIAMLSSVLRSKRAIQVNIYIMRAFVKMRELLPTSTTLAHRVQELENKVSVHDDNMKTIFISLRYLTRNLPKKD